MRSVCKTKGMLVMHEKRNYRVSEEKRVVRV